MMADNNEQRVCVKFCFLLGTVSEPDCRTIVLGSLKEGTNKCVRQGAKESGQICASYDQSELGNSGVA
jgi:hypothetical protein